MEFNEFKLRRERMCKNISERAKCPFKKVAEENQFDLTNHINCYELMYLYHYECEEAIIKWEKENLNVGTNKDVFLENVIGTPWSILNSEGKARCGYPACNAQIPCADCTWWEEPIDALEFERIYEDMASKELSQYKNIIVESEIEEDIKEEIIKVIDGNITSQPDIIIRKPDGELKQYVANEIGEQEYKNE